MYTKFAYWLDKPDFLNIHEKLSTRGLTLVETRKAVCLPMSGKMEIGYVAPEAWSGFETCRRQLSWYGSSEFSGQFLLISSTDIRQHGVNREPSLVISKTTFKPDRLPEPGMRSIRELADSPGFRTACPTAFRDIESQGTNTQSRWLKIMGIRGITYDELFVYHCANHANFIQPRYGLETKDGCLIPYSIAGTKQVCSACLEFFNIIGADFQKKYVVPCPGAVLFAGMSVNTYYLVETIRLHGV